MWTACDQQAWTTAIPGQDRGVCRALVLHWLSMSNPAAIAMDAANLASVRTIMTADMNETGIRDHGVSLGLTWMGQPNGQATRWTEGDAASDVTDCLLKPGRFMIGIGNAAAGHAIGSILTTRTEPVGIDLYFFDPNRGYGKWNNTEASAWCDKCFDTIRYYRAKYSPATTSVWTFRP